MPSTLRTIRRTALAATLTLAVVGAGAGSAIAATPAPDAPSIERTAGEQLRKPTAKEQRTMLRSMKRAEKQGKVADARAAKPGSKKQSRAYLGCIYFSDASVCGSSNYFDVFVTINYYSGGMQVGWISHSSWNLLVYYYG